MNEIILAEGQSEADLLKMFDGVIEKRVRVLGLTSVDLAHGVWPGVAEPGNEDGEKKLKGDRVHLFFKSLITAEAARSDIMKTVLAESSSAAGGYLVPVEFRAELIKRINELVEFYPLVKKVPVNRYTGTTPALATDISMSWDAENADRSTTEPVFTEKTYTIHDLSAISRTSRQLLMDSGINLVAEMRALFSEAVARELDRVCAIGDGSTQPQGISSATLGASYNVNGSLTYAKLVEIEHSLDERYRRRAVKPVWVLNDTNMKRIHALVDSQNRPLWERDVATGQPMTLLGYRYAFQADLPDTEVYFGLPEFYYFYNRAAMTVESTDIGGEAFQKHQLWLKVIERADGKIVLPAAWTKGYTITG